MKYTIVIHAGPLSSNSQGALNALKFTEAALAQKHEIYRLFFYGDGVHNLNTHAITPQGEFDLPSNWNKLINEHKLDAVICIAAGLRRGVLNTTEAKRYNRSETADRSADLSGLGQLIEACAKSDRTITFA